MSQRGRAASGLPVQALRLRRVARSPSKRRRPPRLLLLLPARRCLQTYGRHSNSIDVAKKVCGACKCKLAFLGRFNADSTPAKQRQVSAFGAFVKENFSAVKQGVPAGAAHGDVMKKLSELWKGDGGGGGSENLRPRLDF